MVERLISVDVERLGNVQWWSLVSQYTSDQLVRTMHCEEETRDCCAVSLRWTSREIRCHLPHAGWREERNENCKNVGAREFGVPRKLIVIVVEADPDVARVIAMPAVPRVARRRYVTKGHLVNYGYTDECQSREVRLHC